MFGFVSSHFSCAETFFEFCCNVCNTAGCFSENMQRESSACLLRGTNTRRTCGRTGKVRNGKSQGKHRFCALKTLFSLNNIKRSMCGNEFITKNTHKLRNFDCPRHDPNEVRNPKRKPFLFASRASCLKKSFGDSERTSGTPVIVQSNIALPLSFPD